MALSGVLPHLARQDSVIDIASYWWCIQLMFLCHGERVCVCVCVGAGVCVYLCGLACVREYC
jgi:hypothetical protein